LFPVLLAPRQPLKLTCIPASQPLLPISIRYLRALFFTLFTELNAPNGITAEDFLKQWGPFSFVATYGGKPQRIDISREQTVQMVAHPNLPAFPHITLRKPN
jgi:hypothetical protein